MSAPLINHLREAANADGQLSYAEFTRLALYHPEHGYYRRERERVGRSEERTSTPQPASAGLCRARPGSVSRALPLPLKDCALVELGVEPAHGTLAAHAGDFATYQEIGAGQEINLPERAVVFANELLDAQPFHRFGFIDGQWREYGVQASPEGLSEIILPAPSAEAEAFLAGLPPARRGLPSGYFPGGRSAA